MGVHSEAAAYETLKKLSQSRKATEFITSLIMQYLVDDAKVVAPGKKEDADQHVVTPTRKMPEDVRSGSAQENQAVISKQNEASEDVAFHSEAQSDITNKQMPVLSSDTSQEDETRSGVSMKGIEDAMAIFGF